jgi:hypothetical protein
MFAWITWPGTLGFIGGLIAGPLAWFLTAFVFLPIRRFWDLRGEIAHALNDFARVISGPPSEEILMFPSGIDTRTLPPNASKEFRRLGLAILSFWQNELIARVVLSWIGFNGESIARILLESSEAAMSTATLGPRRSDIAAMLKLKP